MIFMSKKLFVIAYFGLFLLISCQRAGTSGPSYIRQQGTVQGTTFSIIYESPSGEDFSKEINAWLSEFDRSLSIYDPNSLISRLNRNDSTAIPDAWFLEVFAKSKAIWEASDGLFDLTVAPLVNAWGFGPDPRKTVDSTQIDSLLVFVGMDKTDIQDGRLIKEDPRIRLDMNAIAQGYSVDLISRFLENKGVNHYLVEIGGEIRAKGLSDKARPWRIGIDRPSDGNVLPGMDLEAVLELKDRSLATSGNYRKFFIENGIKYSHTIHPKTGYPVRHNLLSVTILAGDCMTADAWATACMASGLEKSKSLLSKHPELDAFMVYSDEQGNYREFFTPGLESSLIRE